MGIYKLKLKGGIFMNRSSPLWATMTDLDMQVTIATLMYLLTPDEKTAILCFSSLGPKAVMASPEDGIRSNLEEGIVL